VSEEVLKAGLMGDESTCYSPVVDRKTNSAELVWVGYIPSRIRTSFGGLEIHITEDGITFQLANCVQGC